MPNVVRIAAVLLLATFAGCQGGEPGATLRGATMGTTYTVRLTARPGSSALRTVGNAVEARLAALVSALSTYDGDSELSRFNRAATTDWVPVSEDLATVVLAGQDIAAKTNGAFDMTVQPLVDLWGFGPAGPRTDAPDPEALAAAREAVGFHLLEARASPPALRKRDPRVQVDLSAIAKGYAVDEVARVLRAHGYANWMVEIGGEIRVAGLKPGERKWQIGVEQPGEGRVELFTTLALTDRAVASSGNYRNFFTADGHRYTHLIDPRRGHPVDYGVGGATVIHEQAMVADAYATTLLVMDPRGALAFAERHGLAAIMFEAAGTGWVPVYSKAFEVMLER